MPKKAKMVGINHVALEVGDLEAALEFYGKIIDFKLRGRHDRMAFLDLGDQFINLSEGRRQGADSARHFGMVVDDREAMREAVKSTEAEIISSPFAGGLDFLDPWGNHVQVVEYGSIQFCKTREVLKGMGLENLSKSAEALEELKEKGMAPEDGY